MAYKESKVHTVLELNSFIRDARSIMSDDERAAIVGFLAANPEAGVQLGGGLRKVRVARTGEGKSGGYRVVYVFGGKPVPIFAVTVFAKNEKSNLSKTELEALVLLSKQLVATYGDRHE